MVHIHLRRLSDSCGHTDVFEGMGSSNELLCAVEARGTYLSKNDRMRACHRIAYYSLLLERI